MAGRTGDGLRAVRAGRYRTPFGLAAASDHAYIGFLRPPLIRYGDYFALSSRLSRTRRRRAGRGARASRSRSASAGRRTSATRFAGTARRGAARAEVSLGPAVVGVSCAEHDAVSVAALRARPGEVHRRRRPLHDAAACRCAASGSKASPSTDAGPPAATSISSCTRAAWTASPRSAASRGSTTRRRRRSRCSRNALIVAAARPRRGRAPRSRVGVIASGRAADAAPAHRARRGDDVGTATGPIAQHPVVAAPAASGAAVGRAPRGPRRRSRSASSSRWRSPPSSSSRRAWSRRSRASAPASSSTSPAAPSTPLVQERACRRRSCGRARHRAAGLPRPPHRRAARRRPRHRGRDGRPATAPSLRPSSPSSPRQDGAWAASPGWHGLAGRRRRARCRRSSVARSVAGTSSGIIAAERRSLPGRRRAGAVRRRDPGHADARLPPHRRPGHELAQLAKCEVVLLSGDRVAASSLARRARRSSRRWSSAALSSPQPVLPGLQRVGDASVRGRRLRVAGPALSGGAGRLLLLSDWQPTQTFVDELRGTLRRRRARRCWRCRSSSACSSAAASAGRCATSPPRRRRSPPAT